MELLVFAHKKEAGIFLDRLNLKKIPFKLNGLYGSEKVLLLITGQGLHNAAVKSSALLALYADTIERIINLGTAGGIDQRVQENSVYSIRSVYIKNFFSGRFFSSGSTNSKIDCLSLFEPISSAAEIPETENIGIVDMELWSIASVSGLFGIPFLSYKVVSDYVLGNTVKETIIEKADFFSKKLWDYYQANKPIQK